MKIERSPFSPTTNVRKFDGIYIGLSMTITSDSDTGSLKKVEIQHSGRPKIVLESYWYFGTPVFDIPLKTQYQKQCLAFL